jgi:hypothetical protein
VGSLLVDGILLMLFVDCVVGKRVAAEVVWKKMEHMSVNGLAS